MSIPYTYLIGWSKQKTYYYGARYAKNATPSDLWTTYFTSSKHVKQFMLEHGDPDIIQIRQTFSNVGKCREWEHKVLLRMDVIHHESFLNRTNNKGFTPKPGVKRPGIGGVKQGQPSAIKGKKLIHNPDTKDLKFILPSDDLPEGFVFGGLPKTKIEKAKNSLSHKGKTHSVESKKLMSISRKGKRKGSNNSNARPITINGITYGSRQEAIKQLGITPYILRKNYL